MATTYGYARCSTDESRQDINRQKRDLKALGVENTSNIFWEYESGTKKDRPEFQRLLSTVQPGDTIAATEVSRLTRSTQQLCELLEKVQKEHLCLKLGAITLDCTTDNIEPTTKGMLMMWGVFAEMERDMISQRVKSGMANAKAKGKHVGRPKLTKDAIPAKFWKFYPDVKRGHISKTDFAEILGVDRKTVYRWISFVETENTKKEA